MSKELTPLEVSKQLKDFVLEFVKNGLDRMFIRGSFDIIETELKQLEKQNKVLKIVKKKVMGFVILKTVKEKYRVYDGEEYYYENLTKEEYELLKELKEK